MAMIDYGVWLIKDGVLVNEDEFFMNMTQAVGWRDSVENQIESPDGDKMPMYGNYFAYAGDKEFSVAVYKRQILFAVNRRYAMKVWDGVLNHEKWNNITTKRMSLRLSFSVCNEHGRQLTKVHLRRITPDVWRATFRYNGSWYKLIFGYGIDPKMKVWNRVKVDYIGKKCARICERELRGTNVWHKIREV